MRPNPDNQALYILRSVTLYNRLLIVNSYKLKPTVWVVFGDAKNYLRLNSGLRASEPSEGAPAIR